MVKRIISVNLDEELIEKIKDTGMRPTEVVTWALTLYLNDVGDDVLHNIRVKRMKAELLYLTNSINLWDKQLEDGKERIIYLTERITKIHEEHQIELDKKAGNEAVRKLNDLIKSYEYDISKILADSETTTYIAAIKRFNPLFKITSHINRLKKLINYK